MKYPVLDVQLREVLGNRVRKLRRSGILPAVVYGKRYANKHVQVSQKEFYKLFKKTGYTNVISLRIAGDVVPVIVKAVDVHPVTGQARHVDFLVVNLKEKIQTLVPIAFVGVSSAVKNLGAVLTVNLDEIEIEVLPGNIPDHIEVDVSGLTEIGDSLSVADLPKSDKYEILTDQQQVIVSLTAGATGVEETGAPEQVLPETPEKTATDET